MNNDGTTRLNTPENEASMALEEVIYTSLGEYSGYFMQQETKGTEIIMPTVLSMQIGTRLLEAAKQYHETMNAIGGEDSAERTELRTVS